MCSFFFRLQLSEATNKIHHEIWIALCAPIDALRFLYVHAHCNRLHHRRLCRFISMPSTDLSYIWSLIQLIIYSQTLLKLVISSNSTINLHITLDNLCRFYHCNYCPFYKLHRTVNITHHVWFLFEKFIKHLSKYELLNFEQMIHSLRFEDEQTKNFFTFRIT